MSQNVPMDTQKALEFLSSSGVVAFVFDVLAKDVDPSVGNIKKGVVVFSVIGNDIVVNEVLKGADKHEYALTEEGLSKYFQSELEESGK